ncbi:pentapeptide repeat-containing protein [Amycolatopsis sp. WAC 04169]|uniref:pentapeptide repeat-containing protein n=1 Tax=Amycolatopsis sp. WAC 04169 TaxID=2203197 RepID=UPI000F781EA2|nr:pentapeptide repeat-containing protein [Amycolatopsis sp. WAC 04169]
MGSREDVQQRINLTAAESLSVLDSAVAEIVLDNATVGAASFTRMSVVDGINFRKGTVTGAMNFDNVESVEVVTFDRSTAQGPFRFANCIFRKDVSFVAATLAGPLELSDCVFGGKLALDNVTATDSVVFSRSKTERELSLSAGTYTDLILRTLDVGAEVRLQDAFVSGPLVIEDSTFRNVLSLERMQSMAAVEIRDVAFEGPVSFHSGTYAGRIVVSNVDFQREVTFDSAQFHSDVVFRDVRFLGPVSFRGARFADRLEFEHVRFSGPVDLDIEANRVDLVNTTFADQASLVLENADLIMRRCRFAAPATVDSRSACRVRSLTDTDATNLTLAKVSLATCQLSDVYNLDKLRVEAAVFPLAPYRLQFSWRWPWALKRAKRRVVVEEALVRGTAAPSGGWAVFLQDTSAPARRVYANDVARVYRQLRKAREDTKDEPNAGDFYYGEMEMRRRATTRFSAEGLILRLYWLTSGYGLRGSRSVVCLAALILACATLMNRFGFADPHTWSSSLVYVVDAATKLIGASASDRLTGWGVVLHIFVRLGGPILLALAILSVRGRTKR